MSEVRVDISGDPSALKKAVDEAKKVLKGLGAAAEEAQKKLDKISTARGKARKIFDETGATASIERARASVDRARESIKKAEADSGSFFSRLTSGFRGLKSGGDTGSLAIKGIGKALKGIAALGIQTTLSAIGVALADVWEKGARAAEAAKQVFQSALGTLVNFKLPSGSPFEVQNRDQLVNLSRGAKDEVGRLRDELEGRGVITQSGGVTGVFKSIFVGAIDAAKKLGGVVNQNLRLETLQNDALLSQLASAEAKLKVYSDQLKTLDEINRVENELAGKGLNRAPGRQSPRANLSGLQGFGVQANGVKDTVLDRTKDLKLPNLLPDNFIVKLTNLQNAINNGVIPAQQGMRQEASLLQAELLNLQSRGEQNTAQFSFLNGRLGEIRESMKQTTTEINGGAVALKLIGTIGLGVLSSLIFKFEEANSKAAKLRNTLRGIGQQLFNTLLNAGLNVGIGALTGNPISFGQGLAAAVGLPVSTTSAAAVPSASGASSGLKSQPIPIQVQALRVSGGDLLLTLQKAQNSRGGGAISLK